MPRDWAGESERDRSVQTYVESLILPGDGGRGRTAAGNQPVTLTLGPRGSGKTTLLRALAAWAETTPVVLLDLAELSRQEKRPVDVLSAVAFGLEPRKKHVPRISFRAFRPVCAALAVEVTPENRAGARRRMAQALAGPPSQWLADVNQVAQVAASMVGLPSAVTAALQLLPLGERGWTRGRLHRRLSGIRRATAITSALDFLIELNLAYNSGAGEDRRRTERVVCEVFLRDLRQCYARKHWAVRCLLLLDNVDNPLGGEVLRLLLEERQPDAPDPLVVLAMAGSYPERLQDDAFGWHGWQHAGGGSPAEWAAGTAFDPRRVADGLRVGRLRDLTRNEVERQAEEILRTAAAPAPRGDAGLRWLGWAVYELTRGQPEGTARVLAALLESDRTVAWEERLRRIFEPSGGVVHELLNRLLPIDPPEGLRQALIRAAAAPDLAQALATRALRDEAADHLRTEFRSFCRDRLRTMHIGTGDEHADGRPETPHPLLRRLLLGALDDPDAVHTALRAEALGRGEPRQAAYHALACGDLPAAAAYLDGIFEQVRPEEWCAELCRLRRAPLPAHVGGGAGVTPWRRYESLVHHLGDAAVGPRLRTVTRLLAASWLGPEPVPDPATDRVGDPYREPLGDPYASLYAEINARFHTLATAHTEHVAWTAVLLDKAGQYDKEPWR